MTFTETDKLKAIAIVHVFETSRPFGDYAACVVLNDGAGVSYGINQFTHRSGSLAAVVEAYLNGGGLVGSEIFSTVLPNLKNTSVAAINKLSIDQQFKRALRSAAVTREMKAAQNQIAFEKYLGPSLGICERCGFGLPLSLAVIYDSVTHGSWERISRRAGIVPASAQLEKRPPADERALITNYIRKRHFWLTNIRRLKVTSYRTKFFLDQIAIGNWNLRLPLNVHGVRLADAMFPVFSKEQDFTNAEAATASPQTASGTFEAETANTGDARTPVLQKAGDIVASAAAGFDRVDNTVNAFVVRRDAAKSMWTTIIGTFWQALWAVFGFFIGLPKGIWIGVAIIAAILILAYLYRQITLGRIREEKVHATG